jgi:hypothetical protein
VKIKLQDGGDGSTFVSIVLSNGKHVNWNPDIPYDGYAEVVIDENGNLSSEKSGDDEGEF